MNLANVGEAWQARAAGIDWPQAFKNRAVCREMTDSRPSQIDGGLDAREAQRMQHPMPFQPWDDMRDDNQMCQRRIRAGLPGVTTHLHHLAASDRDCRVQHSD